MMRPSPLTQMPAVARNKATPARYDRAGDELRARGLYLDMSPWGYYVFEATVQ